MTKKPIKDTVLDVFEEAHDAFPHLKYETTPKQSYEVLVMEFPKQEGLNFGVSFHLHKDDELRIWAGGFSWFWRLAPEPDEVNLEEELDQFRKVVNAILTGDARIVEYLNKKGNPFKARLQRMHQGNWKTYLNYSIGWDLFGLKCRSIRIVQNGFEPLFEKRPPFFKDLHDAKGGFIKDY